MNHDTSNIEAMQWGLVTPHARADLTNRVFYAHPNIDVLDLYLEWLYGDATPKEATS